MTNIEIINTAFVWVGVLWSIFFGPIYPSTFNWINKRTDDTTAITIPNDHLTASKVRLRFLSLANTVSSAIVLVLVLSLWRFTQQASPITRRDISYALFNTIVLSTQISLILVNTLRRKVYLDDDARYLIAKGLESATNDIDDLWNENRV